MTNWDDASHGDSTHGASKDRDAEAQRGAPEADEDVGGAVVPAVADEPTVAPGERQRLLAVRADLVERRRLIISGSARDQYGAMIERIDRRLATMD